MHVDECDGHAVDRCIGNGVKQKVAGVDHQIILKHLIVADRGGNEAIAKICRHHLITSNGGRHLRHRQRGREEDAGVGSSLGRDDRLDISG